MTPGRHTDTVLPPGAVADDPDNKIDLKAFHCEMVKIMRR